MLQDLEKVIVVHYHEIALKKKNRARFENKLLVNIKRALKGSSYDYARKTYGRMLIKLRDDTPTDQVKEKLKKVFGIAYFAEAVVTDVDLENIKKVAWQLIKDMEFDSFKIDARRSQKSFPYTSVDVNIDVGKFIQDQSQATVNLDEPDLTCYIEIADKCTYIYTNKIKGPGGLPVGVSETAVSLISSGIDSPVASYKMLKRGVKLVFAHFHSHPYTDRASQNNTEQLVQILTQYQFKSKLYFVPFIEIQKRIMTTAPAPLRVILYRRYMMKIAEEIAKRERAVALVTGDSVGQVASQTLSNMRVIGEAVSMPVFRPLAGEDKAEIVELARRIGTYEISIEPYQDCCSVFVPRHPDTKADVNVVRTIEAKLKLEPLVEKVLADVEVRSILLTD